MLQGAFLMGAFLGVVVGEDTNFGGGRLQIRLFFLFFLDKKKKKKSRLRNKS